MLIRVSLFRDRGKLGRLVLLEDAGTLLAGPFPALGLSDLNAARAAGNPNRDPLKRMGHTPTGVYSGFRSAPLKPEGTYGKYQVIRLEPVSGAALQAHMNGRRGILIHGGRPRFDGSLRGTYGCIRVSDEHMLTLLKAIGDEEKVRVEVNEIATEKVQ